MKQVKQMQSYFKKNIFFGLITLCVVAALLGILLPISMSDGLEEYSGRDREIAQSRLDEFKTLLSDDWSKLKARVESNYLVVPSSVGCEASSLLGENYVTVISFRTYFGVQSEVIVVTPCEYKIGSSVETLYPNLKISN